MCGADASAEKESQLQASLGQSKAEVLVMTQDLQASRDESAAHAADLQARLDAETQKVAGLSTQVWEQLPTS